MARESCWDPNGITSAGVNLCGERCCKDITRSSTNELLHKFVIGLCTHWNIYMHTHINRDRQCTYKRNIEARSRNHCYLGKAMNVTYSERVCLALVIQHVDRMRRVFYCHRWPVCLCRISPHYVINGTITG